MAAYEQLCLEERPDITIVFGDVNATLACTLAAKKLFIPVAHVEAGLRSYDMTMPEEINRVVVDRIADLHLTPSEDADDNLKKEGHSPRSIKRVGNIMLDSFERLRPQIQVCQVLKELGLGEKPYGVLTLHRPSNVDDPSRLSQVLSALNIDAEIIFPIHPRTRKSILDNFDTSLGNIQFIDPLPYVDFMRLVIGAQFVLTDSGGVQEETSYLGIPCLTLRQNTERPITITLGTNKLVRLDNLNEELLRVLQVDRIVPSQIPLWDGKTSSRIVKTLKEYLSVT
jgi:UDP-N-acetylglucosamine 2-epimerase (non-hydrolysing)